MELFINPLSVNGQCGSLAECENVIRNFNDCIYFCSHSIKARNLNLILDEHLFLSSLYANQEFNKTIGNISPDEKRRWFIFKKNYTSALSVDNPGDSVQVSVSVDGINLKQGNVHKNLLGSEKNWLSFSGEPFNKNKLNVMHISADLVNNFHVIEQLKNLLPLYEPHLKHGKEPYISASGEFVSAMPIDHVHAQKLLFAAKGDLYDGDMWAYCSLRMEYYRFKRTYTDRLIYHGFVCAIDDVPGPILAMLKV